MSDPAYRPIERALRRRLTDDERAQALADPVWRPKDWPSEKSDDVAREAGAPTPYTPKKRKSSTGTIEWRSPARRVLDRVNKAGKKVLVKLDCGHKALVSEEVFERGQVACRVCPAEKVVS